MLGEPFTAFIVAEEREVGHLDLTHIKPAPLANVLIFPYFVMAELPEKANYDRNITPSSRRPGFGTKSQERFQYEIS
jgi:hypothetical protein